MERVGQMIETLTATCRKATTLTSQIASVMKMAGKYVVIDGNDRFNAVKIRTHDLTKFQNLRCRISNQMTISQAMGVAFSMNKDSEDVLRMSDYDKVKTIRKVMAQDKWEHIIYCIFGVNDVSILSTFFKLFIGTKYFFLPKVNIA